ncbi:MAG TPA: anthranilate phosphoribosyltransferase [Chthoniobacteraceae bacterium]|nr:anthranilate phosphoribosyltransferase [Chthoniobacteraceae bacterium]
MQDFIAQLERGHDLSDAQVAEAVAALVSPEIGNDPKGLFLKVLRAKGETAAEIAAFVRNLLERAVDPQIDAAKLPGPMIDVCGTGGDRMSLFNVSTTGMFVLAAGGAVVVKHGNRGITSKCGGADVLETLGVRIDLAPADLKRCVETIGVGFQFAPNYHPAFKVINPVRKMLAERGSTTIFNLLGPLLNPSRPAYQLVGVFDKTMLGKYAAVLRLLGRKRAWALNSMGADEIMPFEPTDIVETIAGETEREFLIHPWHLGIQPCAVEELHGGDCAANAAILTGILDGSIRGPKRDIVLLNAAAGLVVTGLAHDMHAGMALAGEQIDSGRALAKLRALQAFR